MLQEEKDAILDSTDLKLFLRTVSNRFDNYLLQNEMIDIFQDEYSLLGEEEMTTLEQGSHTHLQEYQSFTDLKHSKDKSISCIDWHPTLKGVLGISCVQRTTYDEKIEAGFNRSHQSLVLIWSFQDPIHPQLILDAPDDIQHFQFNPQDPNIIVGGCVTGQIVLWDITEHQDKLKTNRKARGAEAGEASEADDGKGKRSTQIETVRWIAVSSIEGSHRGPIIDLTWIQEGQEVLI